MMSAKCLTKFSQFHCVLIDWQTSKEFSWGF